MKKIAKCFVPVAILLLFSIMANAGEIHDAAKAGNVAKVKELADKDPRLIYTFNEEGKTPLHLASAWGQLQVMELLLKDYHCDVNVKNKYGGTPLHAAASLGQPESIKLLLKYGANINARRTDDGSTPLYVAAFKSGKKGHVEAARVLLENNADVNAKANNGSTALSVAMFRNNTDMINLLRKYGAKQGTMMNKRGMKKRPNID